MIFRNLFDYSENVLQYSCQLVGKLKRFINNGLILPADAKLWISFSYIFNLQRKSLWLYISPQIGAKKNSEKS